MVRGDERRWEEIHIPCARAVNTRFTFLETALPREKLRVGVMKLTPCGL